MSFSKCLETHFDGDENRVLREAITLGTERLIASKPNVYSGESGKTDAAKAVVSEILKSAKAARKAIGEQVVKAGGVMPETEKVKAKEAARQEQSNDGEAIQTFGNADTFESYVIQGRDKWMKDNISTPQLSGSDEGVGEIEVSPAGKTKGTYDPITKTYMHDTSDSKYADIRNLYLTNSGDFVYWDLKSRSIVKVSKNDKRIKLRGVAESEPTPEQGALQTDVATFKKVGDFWNYTGDRAKEIAGILDVTVATRNGKPLVGIPYHAIYKAEQQLRDAGINVVFEQAPKNEEPRSGTPEAESKASFEYAGYKIYQTSIKRDGQVKQYWAVQDEDNRQRASKGEREIGGDSLHETKEAAIKEAERQAKFTESNNAFRSKNSAEAEAAESAKKEAQSKREALDGFDDGLNAMQRGKVIATLTKAVRIDGKESSLRDAVRKLVADGEEPNTRQVNVIQDMTRMQAFRADQRTQDAHTKKQAEAGKKTVYYVGGYDLGKTAHDYAAHLIEQKSAKPSQEPKAEQPRTFQQALDDEHENGVSTGNNAVVRSKQDLEDEYGIALTDEQVVELRKAYQDGVVVSNEIEQSDESYAIQMARREVDNAEQIFAKKPSPDNATLLAQKKDKLKAALAKEQASGEGAPQPAIIEDFGEKIEGARKDLAAAVRKEFSDNDIASLPLSKIWPADLHEKIEDVFVAALAKAAREEIPRKPQKAYALRGWIEKVKMVRGMISSVLSSETLRASAEARLNESKGLEGFNAKVHLLSAIDRGEWDRIGSVKEYPNAYIYGDPSKGEPKTIPSPSVAVQIDGSRENFRGAKSVADVIAQVNEKLGVKPAAPVKAMQFEVRGREGAYFINKKGDGQYRHLKEFKTAAEALDYKQSNHDDLLKAWEAIKERDNVKETDVRGAENRPRTAEDWRNGKDITAEEFQERFGFRGGQFGNWVSQGNNVKERQGMLNHAYDALMDLSKILNIPPEAISLNGGLGMAFGARGHGWGSAHFESDKLVINLTKTRGAGTLAHEWFHALDNYFRRARNAPMDNTRETRYITYKPEAMMVHKGRTSSPPMPKEMLDSLHKRDPSNPRYAPQYWERDANHPEGVRPEVEERFAELVKALNESPMTKRSKLIDAGKSTDYWSSIIERGARAFENYVIAKMAENGYHNDYLANVVDVEHFIRDVGRYPYLKPEELAPVVEAFDNLLGEIKTRETDKGVALYSQSATPANNPHTLSTLADAIDKALGTNFTKLLEATGKFKLITNAEIGKYLGEGAKFSRVFEVDVKNSRHEPPHTIRIIENPTRDQAKNLLDQSKHKSLRGLYNPTTRVLHVWDGDSALHKAVINSGGYAGFETLLIEQSKMLFSGGMKFSGGGRFDKEFNHKNIFSGEGVRFSVAQDQTDTPAKIKLFRSYGAEVNDGKVTLFRGGNVSESKLKKLAYNEYLSASEGEFDATGNAGAGAYGKTVIRVEVPIEDVEVTGAGEFLYKGGENKTTKGQKYPESIYRAYSDAYGYKYTHAEVDAETESNVRSVASQSMSGGRDEFNAELSKHRGTPDIRYSKDGRILAFVRGSETFLVADNISQTDDNVKGILTHEISAHALSLGRSEPEFQSILKQFTMMGKMGNKKVQEAQARVPKDTPAHLIEEESLGYYLEKNSDTTLGQKLLSWFRAAIRKIGKALPGMQRMQWFRWAEKLSPEDIVYMAQQALKSAPQTLGRAKDRGTFKAAQQKQNQTDTPAFKAWFGDSKVVDAEGNPLAVYHGSFSDIVKFGDLTHFGTQEAASSRLSGYGGENASGASIYPAFLSIKNPLSVNDLGDWLVEDVAVELHRVGVLNDKEMKGIISGEITDEFLLKKVRDAGYDGFVYVNKTEDAGSKSWIMLDPAQIKSATGNRGTFGSKPLAFDGNADSFSAEVLSDGLATNANFLRQLAQTRTFKKFGLDGFDIPSNRIVLDRVNVVMQDSKVRNAIVNLVPVEVVDILATKKLTTEMLFSNVPMLSDLLSVNGNNSIPLTVNESAKIARAIAGVTTEYLATHPNLRLDSGDNKSAMSARDDQSNTLVGRVASVRTKNATTLRDGGSEAINDGVAVGAIKGFHSSPKHGEFSIAYNANASLSTIEQFDPKNPDIRYSRAPATPLKDRASKTADALIYNWVDKFNDLHNVQKELPPSSEESDAFLAQERYSKVTQAKIDDLHDDRQAPLVKAIHESGLDYDSIQQYMWAKHAPEYNAEMKKRNPTQEELDELLGDLTEIRDSLADTDGVKEYKQLRDKLATTKTAVDEGDADQSAADVLQGQMSALRADNEDVAEYLNTLDKLKAYKGYKPFVGDNTWLSGMTDAKAEEVIQKASSEGKRDKYEKIAKMVYQITDETKQLMLDSGLITKAEYDAWGDLWKYYVPMHRDEVASDMPMLGQGFNIRGKESKHATGSTKEVTNILAHVMAKAEATIIRSEKVQVDRALAQYVQENPDSDLWEYDVVPTTRTLNPVTGLAEDRIDQRYKSEPNVLVFKIEGREHTITFNERNPEMMRLAAAIKNMSAQELGEVTKLVGKATRFLATMNTSANPVFVFTNFLRDLGTAYINLSDTELYNKKAAVFSHIPSAIRGVWNMSRGKMDSESAKLAREFRDNGGIISHMEFYDTIGERSDKLRKMVDTLGPGLKNLGRREAHAWWSAIEDANRAVENGVRLAAYIEARKAGMSVKKSISLSNNLTVNFGKKGAKSVEFNMWYMFASASINGSANMVKRLGNKRVQHIVAGVVASGFVLDMLARAMAGDDDDDGKNDYDQLPEHVKQRNFVFWAGGRPVTIPMPYGYSLFHNIGRIMSATMGRKDYGVGKGAVEIAQVAIDAFNPVGQSGSLAQLITPTVGDPIAQWAENKNFAGAPLRKEQSPFGPPNPEYQMAFRSVSAPAAWLSEFLNDFTKGNEARPGMININPAFFDFTVASIFGGAGKTYLQTASLPMKIAGDDEISAREIPGWNIFLGRKPEYQVEKNFYSNLKAVQTTAEEMKLYANDRDKLLEIRKERGNEVRVIGLSRIAQAQVQKINERQRMIEKNDPPNKKELLKLAAEQKERIQANFNKQLARAAN